MKRKSLLLGLVLICVIGTLFVWKSGDNVSGEKSLKRVVMMEYTSREVTTRTDESASSMHGEPRLLNSSLASLDALRIMIEVTNLKCEREKIFGALNGFYSCEDHFPLSRNKQCLVYSMRDTDEVSGYNGEEELAAKEGCKVLIYNPKSINLKYRPGNSNVKAANLGLGCNTWYCYKHPLNKPHQYKSGACRTFEDLRVAAGHSNKRFDYVNIDISYDILMDSVRTILYNKDLEDVYQFSLTIYTPESEPKEGEPRQHYKAILVNTKQVLRDIETAGFKKWKVGECGSLSKAQLQLPVNLNCKKLFYIRVEEPGKKRQVSLVTWDSPKTVAEAEEQFDRFIHQLPHVCETPRRYGHVADGGWDVCLDIEIREPCLVYSFGINWDWSFDESISEKHGCQVRAFDPSMNKGSGPYTNRIMFYRLGLWGAKTTNDKNWKLDTFQGLKDTAGDTHKLIDYLKIDIEYSEWNSLQAMLDDGSLKNVKQLGIEIHKELGIKTKLTSVRQYEHFYQLLKAVEDLGFRRWTIHNNQFGMYTSQWSGKTFSCCFEMSYININYLPTKTNTLET